MGNQRGSITVLVAAILGVVVLLAVTAGWLGAVSRGTGRVQVAADAAALAAAQELAAPSGGTPASVAGAYARHNGARVVACRCPPFGSEIVVTVEMDVETPLGTRGVRRSARAVAEPPLGWAGLVPSFASRLGCLFQRVPGISLVSGFRTTEEQAALFREKPGLAAPPGHSKHEIGLAADLGFLTDHVRDEAHRVALMCGLVFPLDHEPWHVEPVGF